MTVLSPNGKYLVIAGAHDVTHSTFISCNLSQPDPLVLSARLRLSCTCDPFNTCQQWRNIRCDTLLITRTSVPPFPTTSLETLLVQLFLATSSKLFVYALPAHADSDEHGEGIPQPTSDNKGLDMIKTIEFPSISGVPSKSNITFRAAR